eukprot:s887_g9.t1
MGSRAFYSWVLGPMPARAISCGALEQPATEPEPEGRGDDWQLENECSAEEEMKLRSEVKQPHIPEPGKLQDVLSASQLDRMSLVQVSEEDGSATSRFTVAAVREGACRLMCFQSPWVQKGRARAGAGRVMFVRLGLLWLAALALSLACCFFLGSLHRYGSHSQLQIAAALFCSLVLATWAAAEASSYFLQDPAAQGYDVAAQNDSCEPPAERVGVADADQINVGDEKDVELANLTEASMAKGLPTQTDLPVWLRSHQSVLRAGAEMSVILALLYLCDRTEVLPEAEKVRDPGQFWAVWAAIVVASFFTVRKGKDSAPLSREQTDEWKGWMQIMFLMYHYFEEKEVYNAIRVYIAAYVWMTGYGNFFLYSKGKSYTIRRTLQMLFRLNFLGFAVCTVLGNEYMLYYICAMHTIFTVFVLLAMYIGHALNTSGTVLWVKIVLTFALTLFLYDGPDMIFRLVFGTLPGVRPLFAFHDPLHPEFTDEMHEFHFRSGLDRFIWIVGMVFALHYEHAAGFLQKLQKESWSKQALVRSGMILASACAGMAWWNFAFRLPKLEYNKIHPYTSFVPLTIYLIVRNLTPTLREYHLHLFAYMGRVTLETYIFQFHIWMRTTGLNGSPKKLLAVIPGYFWPNLVIVTTYFQKAETYKQTDPVCDSSQGRQTVVEGDLLVSDESILAGSQPSGDLVSAGLDSWQVVDTEGLVVAEDDVVDALQTGRGSVEAKMERMLTWMLAPAVHGIPKLGVLPAEERAAELLCQHDREVEAAVREVVAGSERSVSTVVLNFCLERIPVLGCPTVLLRTTWGNLRSILIVAAMYGHDLESARVQHEALLCLVPPGDDKDSCAAALKQQNASDLNPATLVSATAQQVARFMIRGALRRATGLQAAVDCFELASLLYSSCGNDALDEDGFVHVTATPASAARDFFRKKSFASCAILWCSLPFLVLGMAAPNLFMIARFVPTLISWLSAALGRTADKVTVSRLVSTHTVEELRTFAMVATCPGMLLRPRQVRATATTPAQSDVAESRQRVKRRVLVIGIAGASGCGKSTVAQKLAQNMGSPFAPISLDNYLMPKWMPKVGGGKNWETPEGIDFQTLKDDVKKAVEVLAQAETVPDRLLLGPSISRSDVICKGQGGRQLNSEQVVLFLEGFLLFYQQSIAKLFQAKIWIDASLEKHVCTYNYWIPLNMIPWLPRAYVRSAPAVVLFLTGPCVAIYLRPNVQWRKRARTSGILSLFGYSDVGRWERAREKFEEAWPQTVTALVFLLHALLPAISTMSSLSVVLSALSPAAELHGWQGWDLLNRVACASLGLYSLFSVVLHQLQREYPEDELSTASVTVRAIVRGVLVIRVASRAVCFLAAWLYVLLIMDFGVDQLWFWREGLQQGTPLGILGPMAWLLDAERSHLFANEKSVIFCMNLISVISQQRLVEVLSRREVLLRLIGAERVMASTICLLLKGVAVACTPSKSANPIAEFLVRVAPPPACCVAIVALRDHALLLGIAVVVAPRVTGSSSCMFVGLFCGAYAAHAVLSVWYSYRGDLDSAALRLAMLVPGGVSSQAKGLLRGVLAGAHRRAVQLMAMGILQRAFRWLTQR